MYYEITIREDVCTCLKLDLKPKSKNVSLTEQKFQSFSRGNENSICKVHVNFLIIQISMPNTDFNV
jgi:hypothetical protein